MGARGSIEIVGAGLTGVELAAELAAAAPALQIRLVAAGKVGGDLSDGATAAILRTLDRLGVEVASIPVGADVTLDATGPVPEPLGAHSGFALDVSGRIRTDEYLRVLGPDGAPVPGVWGAGDAIGVDNRPWLRGGCASAEPMAEEVRDARSLLARVTTNLAIDRLRSARTTYVGSYLPEPIATGPGADEAVIDAQEVEIALMITLESLSPVERAALVELLATDATLVTDGGGKVTAALRPVVGAERVARFLAGLSEKFADRVDVALLELNHRQALAVLLDGALDQVHWVDVAENRIAKLHIVRNPDKLKQARIAVEQ
ncbi:MAG: hypothetical protein ACTHXA_02410 [Gulosibacter sp.]|uniref:hypothetical protein n=1 Tax=Gulosibacter sp. TaxID=2817531 RepID=UPI003F8DC3F2